MFDKIAKQLELQTLDNLSNEFRITKQEFDDFCKEFLFEEIKGNTKLGDAFCKKYNQQNYVLSILKNKAATEHIRKFYVK
jgi:hypothetical protein